MWEQPFELFGFAWVVMPGNTGFGRWLVQPAKVKALRRRRRTVGARGTSYERKSAWAAAYAAYVNESGILPEGKRAYSQSRMD